MPPKQRTSTPACHVAADEIINDPAALAQPPGEWFGQTDEGGVGLDGMGGGEPGFFLEAGGERCGTTVRMVRMFEPRAIFEQPDPAGGEKAHLGGELPGLLATVVKFTGELAVKKDHRFAIGETELGAAKAEDIDARLPGGRLGCHAE